MFIYIYNDIRIKLGKSVKLEFTIKMLKNESELLSMVNSFFNSSCLWYYAKYNTMRFRISNINHIENKVIPHFFKYHLRGTKYLDFMYFK